jgi:hypothetical protein
MGVRFLVLGYGQPEKVSISPRQRLIQPRSGLFQNFLLVGAYCRQILPKIPQNLLHKNLPKTPIHEERSINNLIIIILYKK